ncbi:integrase catalytic region [Caballeronia udeis]|uniref:Integrase catalytic region n=1 Tax=Caballeronia udeis TaxID=1232866 RepID=A0A158GT85_9BURK|nr:integrase catalytic region [Caballeronia udeis]
MNRRKPELQTIDLATWPGIAWTDLDSEARKIMRQRMHALELFVQGEPVHAIENSTGVNRRQLYRWLERGLSLHADGCVFGFRALQPHSRVVPYARLTGVVVQGERGSRGTAGAFSQLLERYPALGMWLRLQVKRCRVTIEQIHTDGRLHTRLHGLQPLHVAFLQECRAAGLTVADYPFNTDGRAIRSLGARLKAEMLRTFAAGARAAGASHLKGLPYHDNEAGVPSAKRPYQVVEFDGHRLDIRLKIVVRD